METHTINITYFHSLPQKYFVMSILLAQQGKNDKKGDRHRCSHAVPVTLVRVEPFRCK